MTKLEKYLKIGSIEAIAYLLLRKISFERIIDASPEYMTDRLMSSLRHFGFTITHLNIYHIQNLPYTDENYLPWMYHSVSPQYKTIILHKCRQNFCINALKKLDIVDGIDLQSITISELMKYNVDVSRVRHIMRYNRSDLLMGMIKNFGIRVPNYCYKSITYDIFMCLFDNNLTSPVTVYYGICNCGDEILDVLATDQGFRRRMKMYYWLFLYGAIKNHQTRCIEYFLRNLPELDHTHIAGLTTIYLSKVTVDKILYRKMPHYINRKNGVIIPSRKCAIRLLAQMVLYSDGFYARSHKFCARSHKFYAITERLPLEIQTIIACAYGNITIRILTLCDSDIWRELA